MELLKFKKDTFIYYKNHVKGNENITYDQARRKMTRNMILAQKGDSTGYAAQMYNYGSLSFVVNTKGEITWMKNYGRVPAGWKLNKLKYLKLNKQLGIEDDSTFWGLVKKDMQYKIKRFKAANRALQVN